MQLSIMILDSNCFFSQGLEAALQKYFALRGLAAPVFLSNQDNRQADLVFLDTRVRHSVFVCQQPHMATQQKVLFLQSKNGPPNYRRDRQACNVIHRHIEVKALFQEVDRILMDVPPLRKISTYCGYDQVLTPREGLVLSELAQGRTQWQIAHTLKLSPKTVSSHKRNAMTKLGFQRNAELYHWLLNYGQHDELRGVS